MNHGDRFYPAAYLTNEYDDIFYEFQASFKTGTKIIEVSIKDINGAMTTAETKKLSVPIEEFYSILKNEDGTYTVKLFDMNKEVVDEVTVPKEPHINKLENDIIQVIISYGSPFYTTYFFDTKSNLISQTYDTPVLIDQGKIAMVENKKLIVSDIFDKALYFKEIERNFSETFPPSSAIISAKFINSNKLQIDYYAGKDFTEKSEIIDLSKL